MGREPFVGLRPIGEDERPLLFGRERDVEILLNLVSASRIVLVFAPSGTGKSSLLQAGLIPELAADSGVKTLYVSDWTEGARDQLVKAVDREFTVNGAASNTIDGRLDAYARTTKDRPVLILDQFEEAVRREHNLQDLWDEIALIANRPSGYARIVLSIREDYLADLDDLISRVPSLLSSRLRVGPLSREALRTAFLGCLRQGEPPMSAEESLSDLLLDDLEQARRGLTASGGIEPGYFQVVCRRLWQFDHERPDHTLTVESYSAAGGAEGILDAFVNETLQQCLTVNQLELLFALSRYLVLPTGAKSPLSVEDLVGLVRPEDFTDRGRGQLESLMPPEASAAPRFSDAPELATEIADVMNRLSSSEVLVFRRAQRRGRVEYELTHDLLGPILLSWRTQFLVAALDEARIWAGRAERRASYFRYMSFGLALTYGLVAVFYGIISERWILSAVFGVVALVFFIGFGVSVQWVMRRRTGYVMARSVRRNGEGSSDRRAPDDARGA